MERVARHDTGLARASVLSIARDVEAMLERLVLVDEEEKEEQATKFKAGISPK